MNFLGIGPVEILVILAVALIAFGPSRLPELAKHVAKAMKMFREASNELQRQLDMNSWDEPASSTSSYTEDTHSYDDSYEGSYDDAMNGSDDDTSYAADDLDEEESDIADSGTKKNPPTDDFRTDEDTPEQGEEVEAESSPGQHSIDDPDKTGDAQRYAREMQD